MFGYYTIQTRKNAENNVYEHCVQTGTYDKTIFLEA